MRAATHLSFSQLCYLLLVSSAGLTLSPLAAAGAAVASVLPDIDSGSTLVGRLCPPLTRHLETRFGHRTLTHSALAVGAVVVLLLPLAFLERDLYLCLILGYVSHPVLDSMTVTGVQLFYPFSRLRCVFPMDVKHPYRYRVRSGGSTDTALAVSFAALCLPAYLVARTGHEHLIRAVQKDIESAVRDYRGFEHDRTGYARLEARHRFSGVRLSGTYEILGAPDAHTLLVLDSTGRMISVGLRQRAEFIAQTIICQRGEPVSSWISEHDLTGRVLGDLLSGALPDRQLFFGELELDEAPAGGAEPPWFAPVRRSGRRLTLDHARAVDLTPYAAAIVRGGTLRSIVRGHGAHKTEGSSPSLITRLEITGSSFRLLCSEGDLVGGDSLLAVSELYDELESAAAALRDRQSLLELDHAAGLAELARRLSSAHAAVREDSLELLSLFALARAGFTGDGALEEARNRAAQSDALLRQLRSELAARRARHSLQLAEHNRKLSAIGRRRDRAGLRAGSPARVRSIRKEEGRLIILLEAR